MSHVLPKFSPSHILLAACRRAVIATRVLCFVAAVIVGFADQSARAAVVIDNDFGGSIGAYARRYEQIRDTNERVVVDGVCASACTLIFGLLPSDRVCITRRAMFGFHAARLQGADGSLSPSAAGTQLLLTYYPPAVRSWLSRNGGLQPDMVFLYGAELRPFYRRCDAAMSTARR